jgi:hypothetical protein
MTPPLIVPLAPFADALPVPLRLIAARQDGRLSVPIRAGAHVLAMILILSAAAVIVIISLIIATHH